MTGLLVAAGFLVGGCGSDGETPKVAPATESSDKSELPAGWINLVQREGTTPEHRERVTVVPGAQVAIAWAAPDGGEVAANMDGCGQPGPSAGLSARPGTAFFVPSGPDCTLRVVYRGYGRWVVEVNQQTPPARGATVPTTTIPRVRLTTGNGQTIEVSQEQADRIAQARAACARQARKVWLPDVSTANGTCLDPSDLGSVERGRAVAP